MRLALIAVIFFATLLSVGAAEHRGVARFGGLPLPGATITATRGDKRVIAITGPEGTYSFADLADGAWTIRVEMLCFVPEERQVAVAPNAPPLEWEMKLLPPAEMKAVAPASASQQPPQQPQTQRANHGRRGEPRPAPANTPGGFQRADLSASATGAAAMAQSESQQQMQRPGGVDPEPAPSDGFLINGSVNNGANSPFAQSAAFGNNRRGFRPLYNGMLGLIVNNSSLDARPFSLTGQDTPRPGYNNLTGLFSFGGPFRIPGLWPRRNSPYITVNYQWMRTRNASTSTARMPTELERAGDFSRSVNALGQPVRIVDPTTGQPFADNTVPQGRVSPQAAALLRLYPMPNFSGDSRYNFQVPLVGSSHHDNLQTHGNKAIGRRDHLSGNFALESTRSDSTNVFQFLDTNENFGLNASANWMHRAGHGMFLNTSYTFSRQTTRAIPYFANIENVSGNAGITGNNQEPTNWGPPSISFFSGIAGLSDIQSSLTRNQTNSIAASLVLIHSTHNITAGGEVRRQQFNFLSQEDARGSFTFTGVAAGGDFAGFLLGIPDTSSIAFGNADKYLRSTSYSAYFADDWRFQPSLSLNLGVRWEYSSPMTEKHARLVNLDIAPRYSAIAPVLAVDPTGSLTGRNYPESLLEPYKRAVQPRIGIAWRPSAVSSMVIRAGYGVYYDTSVYLSIARRMAQQFPLSKSLAVENSASNRLNLANAFTAPGASVPNTFAVDPRFRPGYAQNWQASIQRDVPGSLVVIATYLGIKGTRAQQQFLPNTFPAGATNPCAACPSGYAFLTSNGNSTRHAGTIHLRRRLRSGFTSELDYTYSKSIDNAALGGRGEGGPVNAQDWLNLNGERGLSNFDQRHVVSARVQYTTGMGLGGGALLGAWKGPLFNDWTFASDINTGSGRPLTPIFFSVVRGTGQTGSIRPDFTGSDIYDAHAGLFLNPASVAPPRPGQWGNAGRNSIIGPRQFGLNASMARTFRVNDRISANFRIDATNALNTVTYSSWVVVSNSRQFGLPVAANNMRSVRSSLRVRF